MDAISTQNYKDIQTHKLGIMILHFMTDLHFSIHRNLYFYKAYIKS